MRFLFPLEEERGGGDGLAGGGRVTNRGYRFRHHIGRFSRVRPTDDARRVEAAPLPRPAPRTMICFLRFLMPERPSEVFNCLLQVPPIFDISSLLVGHETNRTANREIVSSNFINGDILIVTRDWRDCDLSLMNGSFFRLKFFLFFSFFLPCGSTRYEQTY